MSQPGSSASRARSSSSDATSVSARMTRAAISSPSASRTATARPCRTTTRVDPRAEPDLAAPLSQAADQRVGDRARAAFRHGVAPRRGGHGQHEPEARAEPVVRTDVHVERQRRQDPPSRRAGEPALGQPSPARGEDPPETQRVRRSEAAERRERRERAHEQPDHIRLDAAVPLGHPTPALRIARVAANATSRSPGSADDRCHAPVRSRVTAFDRGPAPAEAVALERQRAEGRTQRPPGKECGAHVVEVAGPRRRLAADRAARALRMRLQHQDTHTGTRRARRPPPGRWAPIR